VPAQTLTVFGGSTRFVPTQSRPGQICLTDMLQTVGVSGWCSVPALSEIAAATNNTGPRNTECLYRY